MGVIVGMEPLLRAVSLAAYLATECPARHEDRRDRLEIIARDRLYLRAGGDRTEIVVTLDTSRQDPDPLAATYWHAAVDVGSLRSALRELRATGAEYCRIVDVGASLVFMEEGTGYAEIPVPPRVLKCRNIDTLGMVLVFERAATKFIFLGKTALRDLHAALHASRLAVARDYTHPHLFSVLLEFRREGYRTRLVGCNRFFAISSELAMRVVICKASPEEARWVIPFECLDNLQRAVRAVMRAGETDRQVEVTISADGRHMKWDLGSVVIYAQLLPVEFPLLEDLRPRATSPWPRRELSEVELAALREDVAGIARGRDREEGQPPHLLLPVPPRSRPVEGPGDHEPARIPADIALDRLRPVLEAVGPDATAWTWWDSYSGPPLLELATRGAVDTWIGRRALVSLG